MNIPRQRAGRRRIDKLILGLLFVAVAVPILYFAHHGVIAALSLIGIGVTGYEIATMLERNLRQRLAYVVAIMLSAVLGLWLLSSSRASVNEFMFLTLIAWLVIAPLNLARAQLATRAWQIVLWGFYLVSAWLAVVVLAEYDRWMLIVGLSSVWLIDTCAWFFGSRFGGKALAAEISPNKSWEGVFGALVAMFIFASVLWPWFQDGAYPPWLLLMIASAVTALAVLGDLVASAIKRATGVKNSSAVLGSHGGVLDRIDSWLPALPFFALLSTLTQ